MVKFSSGLFLNGNPFAGVAKVGGDLVLTALNHDTIKMMGIYLLKLITFDFLLS